MRLDKHTSLDKRASLSCVRMCCLYGLPAAPIMAKRPLLSSLVWMAAKASASKFLARPRGSKPRGQ